MILMVLHYVCVSLVYDNFLSRLSEQVTSQRYWKLNIFKSQILCVIPIHVILLHTDICLSNCRFDHHLYPFREQEVEVT